MIAAAAIVIQLYLSCAALLGLFVLRRFLMRKDQWDPVNRRFLFAVRVTMALFLGRVLMTVTGIAAFRILVLVGAALIPLAVLILTEGLLRRHAPRTMKACVAGGTVAMLVSAFWYSDGIDPARLYVLLGFQTVVFLMAAALILGRDRDSLSPQENTTVIRLGLSLIAFIPLAAGDFMLGDLGLPIQFSALGVLVLCWLAIGLARARLGQRTIVTDIAVMVGAAIVVGGVIAGMTGMVWEGAMLIIAAIMATFFVVAIVNDARNLRREEAHHSLLETLASVDLGDPHALLQELKRSGRISGGVVVSSDDLAELDQIILDSIFSRAPVLRKAAPLPSDARTHDIVAYLFDRYATTHVLEVRAEPRTLIAVSVPSLTASDTTDLELRVVQRVAMLGCQVGKNDDAR